MKKGAKAKLDEIRTKKKKTYINYIILGIVSVCSTNIQTVAIVHRLYDPYVIPAVEKLFSGKEKK